MYTTSSALLDALHEAGVEYLFANLGSDHPALMEALAEARAVGRPVPQLVTCPNEMVALSAAHGYAQVSGRAQAVVVHVECGTQALAGAVHNAARGRIPVLIFAGASPVTQEGELRGSRNEFIHWLQDSFDQRGIVRGYMRYDHEIRSGANIKQIVHRALQFATSDPQGPVYLMGAREVMEAEVAPMTIERAHWQRLAPGALAPQGVQRLCDALLGARRPLIVTSYLGRSAEAFTELARLAHRLGIGVLESVPAYVNFAADSALHVGTQWNEKRQNVALAEADVVLVIDSDVPWIPLVNRPGVGARILHIDADPLKQQMALWYLPCEQSFRADAATALRQINERLHTMPIDAQEVEARRDYYAEMHAAHIDGLRRAEQGSADVITPEYLTACVRRAVGEDALVLNEGVTNYSVITHHMARIRPGTHFTMGGSSLGWLGGAAIGAKLARPDALVVAMGGDGSFLFSIPSTVHWMARRYGTPFLQIVFNNGGWRAPKFSMLAVHPDGYGSRAADLGISFEPAPDYAGIAAAAGGAHPETVRHPRELEPALQRALRAVREEKRCAVLDVWLARG